MERAAMLVIFAKLDIPASDSAWIEAIRKRYDPQQQMVETHVTFVFPFEGTSPAEVVAHAEAVARDARPIAFRLSKAAAVRDLDGPGSNLFLLPEDGAPEMRAPCPAVFRPACAEAAPHGEVPSSRHRRGIPTP
jgi:hypothetical protein